METLKKLFYSDPMQVFATKEEMQDLFREIKNQGEDWGPIWEIYFTLRWHIQSQNGDCLAKESLRIMRQELHPDTQLLDSVDPQTREVFEDFVRNLPTAFHGIQNQLIYGRQVFYPSWVLADSKGPCFAPKSSNWEPSRSHNNAVFEILRSGRPLSSKSQPSNKATISTNSQRDRIGGIRACCERILMGGVR